MSEFHASATKTYDNLNDMALATNYAFKELLQYANQLILMSI